MWGKPDLPALRRRLIAVVTAVLGIAPDAELRDPLGRPLPVSRGTPVRAVV